MTDKVCQAELSGAYRTWKSGFCDAASRKSWKKLQQGSDSARLANTIALAAAGEPTEWPCGRKEVQQGGNGGCLGWWQRRWRRHWETRGRRGKGSWTLHTLQLHRCKTKPSPGYSFAGPGQKPLLPPLPPSHCRTCPLHTTSAVQFHVRPLAFLAYTLFCFV